MSKLKKIVKNHINKKFWNKLQIIKNLYSKKKKKSLLCFIKIFNKIGLYDNYNELFSKVSFISQNNKYFYYYIDKYKYYYYCDDKIGNLMIDYNKILIHSLCDIENFIKEKNNSTDNNYLKCVESIYKAINREEKNINNDKIIESLEGIKNRQASGFRDALQRILFFNQIMWQTGHYLNGLGRLDYILNKYYENDIKNKVLDSKEAELMIEEFLTLLYKDYYFKSNSLDGDTGQIIILGGIDNNGQYICNDLTSMFIDAIRKLQKPDPKILLRVNKNTPRKLMEEALNCIKTGIGCPLLANDDVIIPKLIDFGFDKNDVYNYGTAACWEPFITGKAFDQNNLKSISFMQPLENLLENEKLDDISNIKELEKKYYTYLDNYLIEFKSEVDKIKFNSDPLLSIFTDDCIKNCKDISKGGAKYNNYGFTGLGVSNVVNSILMIKKFVFDEKKLSFIDFNNMRIDNFKNNDNILMNIKNSKEKYGKDDQEIIDLTNRIIKYTSKFFENKNNPIGGKYKFGLSAPSYISESVDFPASFDGRKRGEPFGVHISSDTSNGYTELIKFASKLDYGDNRFNGNVIDFFVTPNFIEDNFEKFLDFLIISISVGFFEMQMNVISSEKLIEARNNPKKFPNLIVRVWGFSAYFNDLPDEYKDYIIERALKSEGKYNG